MGKSEVWSPCPPQAAAVPSCVTWGRHRLLPTPQSFVLLFSSGNLHPPRLKHPSPQHTQLQAAHLSVFTPTGTQITDRLTVCCHCWGPGPGDSQLPTAPCYGKVGLCFLGLVPKRKCILGCWAVPGPAARSVGTSTALPEDGSEGQLSCSCHHWGSFLLPEPAMWRSR